MPLLWSQPNLLLLRLQELTDTLEASTQAKEEEEFSTKEASLKLQHSRKEALSVKREFLVAACLCLLRELCTFHMYTDTHCCFSHNVLITFLLTTFPFR